jgi:hypothetical protein
VTLPTASFWSKAFWNAAKNNLIFVCVHMTVQNPIGIALAGLLSLPGPLRVRGLYRTIIVLPTTLSVVIVGFSWNLIVSPSWEAWDGSNRSDDACRPHPGDEPGTDRAGRQTVRTLLCASDLFVVGFIGFPAMNFFPAEVESIEDDTARIAGDSVAHSVSPPARSSPAQPSPRSARPEHLTPRRGRLRNCRDRRTRRAAGGSLVRHLRRAVAEILGRPIPLPANG